MEVQETEYMQTGATANLHGVGRVVATEAGTNGLVDRCRPAEGRRAIVCRRAEDIQGGNECWKTRWTAN